MRQEGKGERERMDETERKRRDRKDG